ncbi:hypothetical protein PUN4_360035 [Paraburkholderia unamae]|nr:hypothetical protein PUN4_360035 [Paraburkholderia unamae]
MDDEFALPEAPVTNMPTGLFNHFIGDVAQELLLPEQIDRLQWSEAAFELFCRHPGVAAFLCDPAPR